MTTDSPAAKVMLAVRSYVALSMIWMTVVELIRGSAIAAASVAPPPLTRIGVSVGTSHLRRSYSPPPIRALKP